MASGAPLSSSASSKSSGAVVGSKRRSRGLNDSDGEMLRELVKVLCECLYRSRCSPKVSTAASGVTVDRPRKTKWFGIVSERIEEVERMMNEWSPHLTTIISISSDSVLTECWSFRYTTHLSESRGRVYAKLMVLVRSMISIAQVLPANRNRTKNEFQIRFCETDGEPFDDIPPLTEEFVLPAVEMSYGKIDINVRYRNDITSFEYLSPRSKTPASDQRKGSASLFQPSIVEDYIGGGRVSSETDAMEEEDTEEYRRWRRWASDSFDERERELARRDKPVDPRRAGDDEDDDDEPDIAAPPQNVRVSSNPMAIPAKNSDAQKRTDDGSHRRVVQYRGSRHASSPEDHRNFSSSAPANVSSQGRIVRKSSNLAERRDSFREYRPSSEEGPSARFARHSTSFGYSVADLVAYSPSGTPILSNLPFAVGSLASSVASVQDSSSRAQSAEQAASLRTKYLTGNDPVSSSPPFPVAFMSAGSLMVSRHSSALALLDHPLTSPSPQLSNAITPPPPQARTPNTFYEAALPWVLTPDEMEKPFSSMGGSIALGAALDDVTVSQHERSSRLSKRKTNDVDYVEDDDELSLPFIADEDLQGPVEENSDLGAFVRRCRDARPILESQETVTIENLRKQLEALYRTSGTDRVVPQSNEVITVVQDERPL